MDKLLSARRPYRYTASYYRKVKFYQVNNKNVTPQLLPKKHATENLTPSPHGAVHSTDKHEEVSSDEPLPKLQKCLELEIQKAATPCREQNDTEEEYSTGHIPEPSDENLEIEVIEERLPFIADLRDWSLRHKVKHTALNELLSLLTSTGIKHLPKDSRTLLRTPRTVHIVKMGSGDFWYNGIKENLMNTLSDKHKEVKEVPLNFNIDGLPVSDSSKAQFWPILMSIANSDSTSPMIVAIYSGNGKPPSAKEFLEKFAEELNELLHTGIYIKSNRINIKVNAFICDTPARCFIKGKR